ncbi:hypothetical protein F5X68DRAFT_242619 [Plectosphaerella plurivora]|uniref:Uncharacterized protein n=1 Tax=Plectosphaerella plurivora TaxID=936078 RepID=A0A9P8V6H7_9PEZI|nr:hypothetical protein F5X68DRAFT_242619 [Plectosphaerella plurivora]
MINMALFYWQKELHEYRQCSIPTPNLDSIQIDYNCDDIKILLDQCPMPGCQCTSKMVSYAAKLAARKHLQDDDLVAVVDLFDDARIQELTSLGSFSYEEETSFKWSRDQLPYTFIKYLQWKWTTVGRDAVTLQWVALMAIKSGRYLFPFAQPDLDDHDEWVTWDGLNLDHPWVKETVDAMPELKPVIRLRLVTRHFENPNDEDGMSD